MSVDTDTLIGIQNYWQRRLGDAFPGPLFTGRMPRERTPPYALVKSAQQQTPEYQAAVLSGDAYVDYRHVIFTVWQIGKEQTGVIAEKVAQTFDYKMFPIPNAVFMSCQPIVNRIEEDEASKAGEDLYKGILEYMVITQRSVPYLRGLS